MHTCGRVGLVAGVATLLALLTAEPAAAQVVTYSFDGEIVSVEGVVFDPGGSILDVVEVDGIAAGATFTGTFSYDPAAALDEDPSLSRGLYFFDPAGMETLSVTIAGLTFATDPLLMSGADVMVGAATPLSDDTDVLELFSPAPLLPLGWGTSFPTGVLLEAAFRDSSGAALDSDALPTAFDPADWDDAEIVLTAFQVSTPDGDVEELRIVGRITTAVVLEAALDVHPGSKVNPVNLRSRGALPVAILSTEELDASQIDPATLVLGDPMLLTDGSGASPWKWKLVDLNRDRIPDLMLHFWTQDMVTTGAIAPETEMLGILGATFDGQQLAGVDYVKVIAPPAPKAKKPPKPKAPKKSKGKT